MGAESRRPPLPAPTDISSSALGTSDDLATDISRVTDRTSYSIPDDGTPVTIRTNKAGRSKDEASKELLIEYFDGSKASRGVTSRPSLRVRVTQPGSSKSRRQGEHIQITETGTNRKPSYTRRISLPQASADPLIPSEISELSSTSSGRPPVEVEVLHGTSDLSQRRDESPTRYIVPASDISSIPTDSLLEESTPVIITPRERSPLLEETRPSTMDTLKAPSHSRSRSLSKERIAQNAIKKIQERHTTGASGGKQKSMSRRSSGSSREYVIDESASPKSRSRRTVEEERLGSNLEPSEISAISDQSTGQHSIRSGTSNVSINNPKLLSAVEDAIKRLILPELNAVKEEQRRQKNRHTYDDITRDSMAPVGSRENLRRVSKSSSSPNVAGRPGIVTDDQGLIDAGDSVKIKKRRSSRGSDRSHETAIREETSRRSSREKRDKHSSGNLAAAALVGGGLTAAALKHHDSIQDINEEQDRRERRKRRSKSKSRSRTASISESVEEHTRHREDGALGIPPLPLQQSSAVGTDATRDSILSADHRPLYSEIESLVSEHDTTTHTTRHSPRQVASPTPRTPTRTPLSTKSRHSASPSHTAELALTGAGLAEAGDEFMAQHNRIRSLKSGDSLASGRKSRHQSGLSTGSIEGSPTSPGRSHEYDETTKLEEITAGPDSPNSAQPAATDRWFEEEHQKNEQLRREYESESQLGSDKRHTMYTDDSFATDYDKSFESGRDIRAVGANPEYVHTPAAVESAVASLHEPSLLGSVRSSQKTDSVHDETHFDGLESPRDFQITNSQVGTSKERWEAIRDHAIATARQNSSPRHSEPSIDGNPIMGASAIPLQHEPMPEIGHGFDDDQSELDTNPSIIKGPIGGLEHGDRSHWPYDPTPALANRDSSVPEDHDHAARDLALGVGAAGATVGLGLATSRSKESNKSQSAEAAALRRHTPVEQSQSQEWVGNRDNSPTHVNGAPAQFGYASPAGGRGIDEGYMSGAIPGGEPTPDVYTRDRGYDNASLEEYDEVNDPFTTSSRRLRYASGLSHGMASPLYDAAMGKGIDRIKDRDVVALMDHLTVRDAQRNARDIEIMVTLVRNAADMRNQWDDMKKFIQDQDRMVMGHNEKTHDKTVQRVLGGPRPLPNSGTRAPRRQQSEETEESTKSRKNFLRRAFKGMSSKNTHDLTKIEGMLMQLLDEVEDLKSSQAPGGGESQHGPHGSARSNSMESYDHLRSVQDPGYEPEGMAGTSSSPAHSGHLSNNSSKHIGGMHSGYDRRNSEGHRISTVLERDEEDDDWTPRTAPAGAHYRSSNDGTLTPTQETRRGASVPLDASPDQRAPLHNSRSAEATPRTEKNRKHKSGSSIFNAIPKISRWSKTTTSTVQDPDSIRNSARKDRANSMRSLSGEDLHLEDYDDFRLEGDDRLRSQNSLQNEMRGGAGGAPRSPSPLIPDQRRSLDEPKYRSHERDSLILEHPQPRIGPTERNKNYLEYQALDYENPPTPDADQWGTTPALALNRNMNRFSGSSGQPPRELSPVHSEDGADAYSDHSASEQAHNRLPNQGPPRPPKIREGEESPLVPPKVPFGEDEYSPQSVGFGYHSPYSNSGMHIASPLEPIEEVRYSLETDRSSGRRDQMTPSPRPTAMHNLQRKITGPREMPQRNKVVSPGPEPIEIHNDTLHVPWKAVGQGRKSPVPSLQSLESYRSSLDSEIF